MGFDLSLVRQRISSLSRTGRRHRIAIGVILGGIAILSSPTAAAAESVLFVCSATGTTICHFLITGGGPTTRLNISAGDTRRVEVGNMDTARYCVSTQYLPKLTCQGHRVMRVGNM